MSALLNLMTLGSLPLSFYYEFKKGPNLSVEALLLSAISFRLPSDSISAAASFRLTPVVRFRFQPLWAVRSTAYTASLPLSDPLCFGILSSASVSGSDYSASVSSFPTLPVSASQWLPQCSDSAFASSVFPVLSRLVSRALLPGSGTQLCCMFPFALPRFAPTAVPQVLTSGFRLPYFPLPVRFLSSTSVPLPATKLVCIPFLLFPVPPYSWLSRCLGSALASPLFPFSPA